jgi:DNA-binding MarR family transcriptional regulator
MDALGDVIDQWSDERPELDTECLAIVMAVDSLHRKFRRQAAEALAMFDLELFEYDVLSALRRQGRPYGRSASEIARQTDLSTAATTNRVDRLEARSLVKRGRNENDRRGVIVYLTGPGLKLVDAAVADRMRAADLSLSALTADERRDLDLLLKKVRLSA